MRAVVFNSAKKASDAVVALDSAMGYPRPGVDVGGGVHAPVEVGTTKTCTSVVRHSTKSEWAMLVDELAEAEVARSPSLSKERKEADVKAWDGGIDGSLGNGKGSPPPSGAGVVYADPPPGGVRGKP